MKLPEFFGIDIGNHSLKVAQVNHKGENKAALTSIGYADTPVGILSMDTKDSQKQLADEILKLRDAAGITTKKMVAALPEASIFNRMVLLPDVPDKELEESVYYEAKQYLPTPVSEVNLDHIPIAKIQQDGKKLIRALIVAAPKSLTQKYMELAQTAQLELLALETESIATTRALTFNNDYKEGALVLDFGSHGTGVSVVKQDSLIFSQSIGTGSDALTKAIAADFGLDYQQAEQYKRSYGVQPDQADGKIARSLEPVMQVIINEINKTLNYFRAHLQESTPKKIYIVGDGAKLPGLSAYLSNNLGIETTINDPVSHLEVGSKIEAEVAQLSTVGFTVSIGLALKQE